MRAIRAVRTAVRLLLVFPFASVLAFSPGAQSTWYVDGTCGSDAWSGSSPVCQAPDGPKRTIQAAMDAALRGDTVLVADGVYTGQGNKGLYFPALQNFALRSAGGPQNCIIDLQGSGLAFAFVLDETPDASVEGFAIRNGYNGQGGGIFFHHNSRVTVQNCVFENNFSYYGGGAILLDNDSSPTIIDCRMTGNSGLYGGGAILLAGSSASSPRFINCLITGNTAVEGGGVYFAGFGDAPELFNCTITGNSASEEGGAIYVDAYSTPSLVNSILWGNPGGAIGGEGEVDVSFSDIEGGWPGIGNIDADPLFGPLGRPSFGSPCIDVGLDQAVVVILDLAGKPRIFDGDLDGTAVVDMGALEFQPDRISPRRRR